MKGASPGKVNPPVSKGVRQTAKGSTTPKFVGGMRNNGWRVVPRTQHPPSVQRGWQSEATPPREARDTQWKYLREEENLDTTVDGDTSVVVEEAHAFGKKLCHLRTIGRRKALTIRVTLRLQDDSKRQLQALVDTGSEFNLCNRKLFDTDQWNPAVRPVTFVAANQSVVPGGEDEIQTTLDLKGRLKDKVESQSCELAATFYGADIGVDLILSYNWLMEHDIMVCPKEGALILLNEKGTPWVKGLGREKENISPELHKVVTSINKSASAQDEFSPDMEGEGKEALRIPVMVVLPQGGKHILKALVDSGAEFNLCNRRLLSSTSWKVSTKPVRLMAANQSVVPGGDETLDVRLIMNGKPSDPGIRLKGYNLPATLYGADISEDLILSYSWLVEHNVLIYPKEHALILGDMVPPVWIKADAWDAMDEQVEETQSSWEATASGKLKGKLKFHFPPEVREIPNWRDEPQEASETEDRISEESPTNSYWEMLDLLPQTRVSRGCNYFQCIGLRSLPEVQDEGPWTKEELHEMVSHMPDGEDFAFIGKVVSSTLPEESLRVKKMRERILKDYKDTVFSPEPVRDPPKRGPLGEAEIRVKEGARPVNKPPFHITGERLDAMKEMVQALVDCEKIERASSAWCSPAFPVAKKEPGKYRLVVDYRALNDVTVPDSNPLPRIEHILQNQGQYKMWSVLDMKDGYHQVPLKEECRDYTCMSTPLGNFRWKVLVMGLRNGNAIFQRVMDYVLSEHDCANGYIDDVIVGSKGETEEELIENHDRDLRAVLETLAGEQMRVNMKKPQLFMRSVQFCGHVLVEGKRFPAPDKLVALQNWELPKTVTALRGFLGLANYYSGYVPHFAEIAAPMTSMLQLNRQDGRKGSKKVLKWSQEAFDSFKRLKEVLTEKLEVFHLKPDCSFYLRTDASKYAIGAVLEQVQGGERVPVAFFSRKLTGSQKRWSPREQETYAIVTALRKWSGWIGLQPVVVLTDHKALESWVTEHVDTPSGPAGRRGRWHETLSKFDIQVQYVPGKENVVADALSRWAYPASKALQDCSWHGSAQDWEEMQQIMKEELEDGKMVGLIPHFARGGTFMIFDPTCDESRVPHLCGVTTRSRTGKGSSKGGEDVATPAAWGWPQQQVDPPPPAAREGDVSSWHVGDTQAETELATSSNSGRQRRAGKEGRAGDAPSNPSRPEAQARRRGGQEPLQSHFASERQRWSPEGRQNYERALRGDLPPQENTEQALFDQDDSEPEALQGAAEDGGRMPSTSGERVRSEEHSVPSNRCTDSTPQPEPREEPQLEQQPPRRTENLQQSRRGSEIHSESPQEEQASSSNTSPLDTQHVMDMNWGPWYEKCSVSSAMLEATRIEEGDWPAGLRLEGDSPTQRKLYLWHKLVVPQGLTLKVLMAHHVATGHMGIRRMEEEVKRKYHLCTVRNLRHLLGEVKGQCQTCQACAAPNWSTHGPIEMNWVPERCMSSVALDLFSLPRIEFGGMNYDSLLVCVDRQSGWIVAVPCEKTGLTGKKAAQLMLEKWEMFGIPDTIVSDKGQQFISAWWRTMCAQLGVRQTYGISYRSQTNGRAEVAGKTLIGLLRKIQEETGSNWVEALPRALRFHNDAINDTGMSPYQILFGRERSLGGIPTEAIRTCEDAGQFMERMREVDRVAMEVMNQVHKEQMARLNRSRRERENFKEGDWVWVARPKTGVTGHKLNTSWIGPAKVLQRVGRSTYKVQVKPNHALEVHLDQLKRHIPDGITGRTYKLFHHQMTQPPEEAAIDEWNVEAILEHRRGRNGKWEFLTLWEGWGPEEATWEPMGHFIHGYNFPWVAYCKGKGLFREITGILKSCEEAGDA